LKFLKAENIYNGIHIYILVIVLPMVVHSIILSADFGR
jgi:hypothetical protein